MENTQFPDGSNFSKPELLVASNGTTALCAATATAAATSPERSPGFQTPWGSPS